MSKDYNRGVYGKYRIEKADGTPCDPYACYFVLRLDREDDAARAAMIVYARLCGNKKLAKEIRACIRELDESDDAHHCGVIHFPPVSNPVWEYGEASQQTADELPKLDMTDDLKMKVCRFFKIKSVSVFTIIEDHILLIIKAVSEPLDNFFSNRITAGTYPGPCGGYEIFKAAAVINKMLHGHFSNSRGKTD